MNDPSQDYETRRVVIGALHGTIEGNLRVSARLRTLDFLNRNISRFVTVQDARVTSATWQPETSTSSICASSILWVAEVQAMRPSAGRRRAPLQNRSAVRLCMPGGSEVRGFLHTPLQGDPIVRLNQDQSAFFAVTSASLMSPDSEFAAAFLAVHRAHVFAAENLLEDDMDDADPLVVMTELAEPVR